LANLEPNVNEFLDNFLQNAKFFLERAILGPETEENYADLRFYPQISQMDTGYQEKSFFLVPKLRDCVKTRTPSLVDTGEIENPCDIVPA